MKTTTIDDREIKIYFRIPFFNYFLARDLFTKALCFAVKEWDGQGYYWQMI